MMPRFLVAATSSEDGGQAGVHTKLLARAFVHGQDHVDATLEFVKQTGYVREYHHDKLSIIALSDALYSAIYSLPSLRYEG